VASGRESETNSLSSAGKRERESDDCRLMRGGRLEKVESSVTGEGPVVRRGPWRRAACTRSRGSWSWACGRVRFAKE
jgi:hypothetical protein